MCKSFCIKRPSQTSKAMVRSMRGQQELSDIRRHEGWDRQQKNATAPAGAVGGSFSSLMSTSDTYHFASNKPYLSSAMNSPRSIGMSATCFDMNGLLDCAMSLEKESSSPSGDNILGEQERFPSITFPSTPEPEDDMNEILSTSQKFEQVLCTATPCERIEESSSSHPGSRRKRRHCLRRSMGFASLDKYDTECYQYPPLPIKRRRCNSY